MVGGIAKDIANTSERASVSGDKTIHAKMLPSHSGIEHGS